MNKIDFSFVLPAFNEEKNITGAIDQASKFLSRRFKRFEIIVVDDGSRDGTYERLKELSKSKKNIKVIRHPNNLGYGSAVWDGLRAAKGDLIFFTDSDLQFDLKDLGPFLKEIKDADAIIGYRVRRAEGFRRRANAICWGLACYVTLGIRQRDIDCAFKLFRREALKGIKIDSLGATFSAELIYRMLEKGCRFKELPVRHLPRIHGKPTGSKVSVIFKAIKELITVSLNIPKLTKKRERIIGTASLILLFLSRFLFLSNSRDFFDSSEYLWREKIPEMIRVLTSGHPPFHPMYVGLSSLFYKMGIIAHDGTTAAIMSSALLGCLSVVFAFLLSQKLFGKKIAWTASVIYALLPFVYTSQITILVDPTMHGFYFASLYVFVLSLERGGKKSLLLAALSGILLGAAAFTHTSIAFWATAYPGIWLIKSERADLATLKKDYLKFIIGGVCALWSVVAYVYLLIVAHAMGINDGQPTIEAALRYLLLGNSSDHGNISLYLSAKYFFSISTVLVGLLSVAGFIRMIFKNFKNALGFFIWFVPSTILTANYIYENLHGRAMIPALLPAVLLCVIFIFSLKKIYLRAVLIVLVILQVGSISIPAAIKYATKLAPYEQIYLMQKSLEAGGVFISSNVTRTFNEYSGSFISFGDVGQGAAEAEKAIDSSLADGKKAYISIDAIWYPKRRFDGMFYDIRANAGGKSENQRTLLDNVFESKAFVLSKMNALYNQAIYSVSGSSVKRTEGLDDRAREHQFVFGRILSQDSPLKVASVSFYQNNLCMTDKNDITYGDWGFCLYRMLTGNRDVDTWTFTDKDGWFYAPVSGEPSKVAVGYSAEQSRLDGPEFFVKTGSLELKAEKSGTFSLQELEEKINTAGSFYAVSRLDGGGVVYDLYVFSANIEKTNRIEGEDLVSEVGSDLALKNASGGAVVSAPTSTGYLVSGPYINLAPGKYKATFVVRRQKNGGEIAFDVISNLGKNELAKGEYSEDEKSSFDEETLEFNIDSEQSGSNVEFRVCLDNASAVLDYIDLAKID